jgi:hypothetical protein
MPGRVYHPAAGKAKMSRLTGGWWCPLKRPSGPSRLYRLFEECSRVLLQPVTASPAFPEIISQFEERSRVLLQPVTASPAVTVFPKM